MESGFGYFPTHDAVDPATVARVVEERGHAALLFAEHTHIPVGNGIPPGAGGSPLPRRYWHTHDLMVACTAAGLATTRLRVGSGICLVPQHEPIGLAKTIASIDQLTGGRFEFGVGAGWNDPETANHGVDPKRRFAVMREHIEAMQQIWTVDEAEYHGQFVSFDPIFSWPKPARRPHPPILVGGAGPRVFDRVLAYGDAWLPNYAPEVMARIPGLHARAADVGRTVDVQLLSVPADPAVLEACEAAGVRRVMPWLPSAGIDRIEAAMEAFEAALADQRGE